MLFSVFMFVAIAFFVLAFYYILFSPFKKTRTRVLLFIGLLALVVLFFYGITHFWF